MSTTQKPGLTSAERGRICALLQIELKELEEFWGFRLYTPPSPSCYSVLVETNLLCDVLYLQSQIKPDLPQTLARRCWILRIVTFE